MKLDKRQINALASNFYDEIEAKINKENIENKIKSLEKFRSDYNKGIKLLDNNRFLKSIVIDITKGYSSSLVRNESFETYTKNYSFNNVINEKQNNVTISKIEQDIILATIDSQSIEDIMKVLKFKYK